MIRHLVLFKLNEGVRRDDPKVVEGVEAFRALEGKIPEIRFWECAWNISDRSTRRSTTPRRCTATSSTRTTRRASACGASSPRG